MKKYLILSLTICFILTSCGSLKNALPIPTDIESALALKHVLNSSAFKALNTLQQMRKGTDGLPDEIKPVLAAMTTLGYGDKVESITQSIVKASDVVAVESELIMKQAIDDLTFKDAANIVVTRGAAATGVLKQAMYKTITSRYSSRLDEELTKSEVKQYWPIAASAYNIFAKEKVDGQLSDFLAKRAVDGLFLTMGTKEVDTRAAYKQMGNKVVNKVFDYYQDKKLNSKGKIVRK